MKITQLEDLQIWQLAKRFVDAVSAILDRPSFRRDRRLHDQLDDSTLSILSNIAEGFGQRSDRRFASYLAIARGSNNEAISQLAVARVRRHLSEAEYVELKHSSQVLGKMITRLIGYLDRCDRPCRG